MYCVTGTFGKIILLNYVGKLMFWQKLGVLVVNYSYQMASFNLVTWMKNRQIKITAKYSSMYMVIWHFKIKFYHMVFLIWWRSTM